MLETTDMETVQVMELAALFGGQVLNKVKAFPSGLKISMQILHVKESSTSDVEP